MQAADEVVYSIDPPLGMNYDETYDPRFTCMSCCLVAHVRVRIASAYVYRVHHLAAACCFSFSCKALCLSGGSHFRHLCLGRLGAHLYVTATVIVIVRLLVVVGVVLIL